MSRNKLRLSFPLFPLRSPFRFTLRLSARLKKAMGGVRGELRVLGQLKLKYCLISYHRVHGTVVNYQRNHNISWRKTVQGTLIWQDESNFALWEQATT